MSDPQHPLAKSLFFRLAALALDATAKDTGVPGSLVLRIVGSGELRVDFGFPEGTLHEDALIQAFLHHLGQYEALFEAEHRIKALGEHGVPESQLAQERARWEGHLPQPSSSRT